jgi:hypothetical protein
MEEAMKKSVLLVLGVCLLCLSVMFLSCDGDSSTDGNDDNNGDPSHPSSLVGLWHSISMMMSEIITTNSNQTAIDLFSEGTGALNVTGGQTASLTYMMVWNDEGEISGMVTNVSFIELFGNETAEVKEKIKNPRKMLSELKTELTYPLYVLQFSIGEGAMFYAVPNASDTLLYWGTGDGLTYDAANYKLTANNMALVDMENFITTIAINGQLQNKTINVPANTPTVAMTMDATEMFDLTLDINTDGTYMGIYDYGLGVLDTTNGTWEVTGGNNLMIVDYYTEDGDTVDTDTSYATYAFSGNNLVLTTEDDACIDDENPDDCLADIEDEVGIDEGSLVSAFEQIDLTFSKAVAAKL